jgi:hypothetical protein
VDEAPFSRVRSEFAMGVALSVAHLDVGSAATSPATRGGPS